VKTSGRKVGIRNARKVPVVVIVGAGFGGLAAARSLRASPVKVTLIDRTKPDLSVQDHPEVFVIGDTAFLEQDGKPLPGVAQVAMQQGRYAGKQIVRQVTGQALQEPFRYFDKGNLAVVGKGFAVLQSGKVHASGFLAWLVWAAVHLQLLAQSSLRVSAFVQWVWTYFTGQRGSRIIVKHHGG
jgi:NADH dehydrogenase FAD-containing subunit